jgi:hypothetical protein
MSIKALELGYLCLHCDQVCAEQPRNSDLIPGCTMDFSPLQSIQTNSEAHQASYLIGTGLRCEADDSPPSSGKVKCAELYLYSKIQLHSIVLN